MTAHISKSVLGGLAGTAVMTVFMMIGPMMGFPPMNVPELLSGMMGMPIAIGWVMHFMVGVIFAVVYGQLFVGWVPIPNVVVKGAVFGVAVFLFSRVAMWMSSAMMGPMPAAEGSMVMLIMGGLLGHIVFGIVVALIARPAPAK